jgi:hypothetical protein
MAFRVSCGKCGQAYYLGDEHKCPPRPAKPVAVVEPKRAASECVPKCVTNRVTNLDAKGARRKAEAVKRVRRWRARNLQRYRDYQRDLMRKRRELARAA